VYSFFLIYCSYYLPSGLCN